MMSSSVYLNYLFLSKVPQQKRIAECIKTLHVVSKINKSESKHGLLLFFFLVGAKPAIVAQCTSRKGASPTLYGFKSSLTAQKTPMFLRKYLRLIVLSQDDVRNTVKKNISSYAAFRAVLNTFTELDILTLDSGYDRNILSAPLGITCTALALPKISASILRNVLRAYKVPLTNYTNRK